MMAIDFPVSMGVRPAFNTATEDRIHAAWVDYYYEDDATMSEDNDHYNLPGIPAWAEVLACYSFASDSRPGIVHVAVTFEDPAGPGKTWTVCGCDAARHERLCWHLGAVAELEAEQQPSSSKGAAGDNDLKAIGKRAFSELFGEEG